MNLSIRRPDQTTSTCLRTIEWKNLRENLRMHSYKIQLVQEPKPQNHKYHDKKCL